ncbi:uncharacterized protein SAPINGB_P001340 [Magnusiomyces paraingens]|uniref:Uncharacterized protein n=1 Tax=Magnusiomyces paraingens TaxID=2606893 RepID=A0A5E8B585_9ASCO|nr:uncharacterized protein SAPINGB_P001340 [Saprochaete ingens]VVT46693.1 unnamed protein product [Saprochaete ingens]
MMDITLSQVDKHLDDAISTLVNYTPSDGITVLKEAISTLSSYSQRYAIIRDALYPRFLVSSKIVVSIIGIKHDHKSHIHHSVHSALLKWLVIVYSFLEDPLIISKLYTPILAKVPYESTRQWWRIQLLTEYYVRFPSSQYITALLRLYQSYAPLLFVGSLPLLGSIFNGDSGMLVRLLLYKGSSNEWDRFNSWLLQHLYDTFQRGAVDPAKNSTVMGKQSGPGTSIITKGSSRAGLRFYFEQIVSFSMYTKRFPYAAEEFLYEYLTIWDGIQNCDLMFKLISLLPMNYHEFVEDQILEPLKRVVVSNYASRQVWVFELLTQLIRNWRIQILSGKGQVDNLNITEQCRTLRSVVCFVDYYGLFAVEKFKENVTVALSIILFFKEIAMFPYHNVFPVVLSMSSDLLYYLFMSRSGVIISHCSDLLVRWKPLHLSNIREKPLDRSIQYQGYVLDFCNSLWLNKSFEIVTKSSPDLIVPSYFSLSHKFIGILQEIAAKESFPLAMLFGFSHSIVFARQAAKFLRSVENKVQVEAIEKSQTKDGIRNSPKKFHRLMEPPTYTSLKLNSASGGISLAYAEFRISFLDTLEENGYTGLYSLLYTSMRKLMERRPNNRLKNGLTSSKRPIEATTDTNVSASSSTSAALKTKSPLSKKQKTTLNQNPKVSKVKASKPAASLTSNDKIMGSNANSSIKGRNRSKA